MILNVPEFVEKIKKDHWKYKKIIKDVTDNTTNKIS